VALCRGRVPKQHAATAAASKGTARQLSNRTRPGVCARPAASATTQGAPRSMATSAQAHNPAWHGNWGAGAISSKATTQNGRGRVFGSARCSKHSQRSHALHSKHAQLLLTGRALRGGEQRAPATATGWRRRAHTCVSLPVPISHTQTHSQPHVAFACGGEVGRPANISFRRCQR
jgi:hypothetical protein